MPCPTEQIRNFCIIAHIDHGKTTLADRILELCGALDERERTDQFLDKMELERERGITIKAQAVRLKYQARDGKIYQFNLIDTPGHVDFNYEVSRSLTACEGALLVVDAAQGVEAQTLANVYLALDANLEIVPVLNKIDLPVARPDEVIEEIEETIGLDAQNALRVSAKTGQGVDEVLEAVVERIPPPPSGLAERPLKALIFDSWYDSFRGVVVLVRVVEGSIRKGTHLRFWATGTEYECTNVGVFSPNAVEVPDLFAGEVGVVAASIKDIAHARVGDTITDSDHPSQEALPGFKRVQPMVFAGLFPVDAADYGSLKDALGKLVLNDAAVTYEPENSTALGFGFRCGFLGLLHMEIIQERLEREFDLDLITTAPSVCYRVHIGADVTEVENPAQIPDIGKFDSIDEPIIRATIHVPQEYVGPVVQLCEDRRGTQIGITYGQAGRVQVAYELPLCEVVFGYYDRLKTLSRGYASLDYEPAGYRESDLVRLDVLVNGDKVDALSIVCHRQVAYNRGQDLCVKMKEVIHRQMFAVAIQAAIGSRVIARTTVKALRKDVTAKCYGGDISRKRKLLEKQKKGKRRMKAVGSVELPQEAFLTVLKVD
jgi:GTP-binding protein LepA